MLSRKAAIELSLKEQKKSLDNKKSLYNEKIAELCKIDKNFAETDLKLNTLGARLVTVALSGDKQELCDIQSQMCELSRKRADILKKSGIGEIEYTCDICKDSGYVSGRLCKCIENAAKIRILENLKGQIPIDEFRFDNFDLNYYPEDFDGTNARKKMTEILKLCKEYVLSFNPSSSENLLFMGKAGLGKTHLSVSIVSGVIEKGYDVIYGSAYNLFSQMENEHFASRSNDSFNSACECDLLVIDDLGGEFISPYIQSLFYNIVNTRLLSRKPTVISTNLSMAEIEKFYTPRVSSRLLGAYTAKKFFGKDIRQIKAMEKNK